MFFKYVSQVSLGGVMYMCLLHLSTYVSFVCPEKVSHMYVSNTMSYMHLVNMSHPHHLHV
jgi:hypothetical protein